jgi:putative hemolysin
MDYALFCLLLCSSFFFSGSETSFFKLTGLQLAEFKEAKSGVRRRISQLRNNPRDLLITVLLGNELTNIAISIVGAGIISRFTHDWGMSLIAQAMFSSLVVVPVLLITGEITPKTVASFIPTPFATLAAYPLSIFSWLVTPIKRALGWASGLIVKRFAPQGEGPQLLDERGFKALVDAGAEGGAVEHEERVLIHNAFHFGDLDVRVVMTPWEKVLKVDAAAPTAEALRVVNTEGYSRMPMLHSGVVVGALYAKDLLPYRWGEQPLPSMQALRREVIFTTPKTKLNTLMDRFKRDRKHFAVVINARNEPVGVCTMDDLLQVLFGPIEEGELR